MSDNFTEVTQQSWFSRMKSSLSGAVFGLLIFLGAFVLLFWNEGRAVKTHKMLQEGAGVVVSVDAGQVLPDNEGKLVHLSGKAITSDELSDPIFEVSVNAIRLYRKVEMLQWKESQSSKTEKKLGGSTETTKTYSYAKDWSESIIDSSQFKKPKGHKNPSTMIMESESWEASDVTLGAFKLSQGQIRAIDDDEVYPLKKENKISKKIAGKSRLENGVLYLGSKKHNDVGDFRIQLRVVYPSVISVVSGQSGNGFKPYQTQVGGSIQMLSTGTKTAKDMFGAAESANTTMTWILRFVGLIMMYAGLKMMVAILTILADVVPFIGNIVGAGTSLIAFLIALVLSLVTIAVAWVFYRPLLSGILIVAAIGILFFARSRAKGINAEPEMEVVEE